ncbi:ABC transporter ATP-binding protein [Nitrospirillum bahiense]|uniref:ABC-2 type transport system ATP-binding protein n=1 Tax=Nitrospirillum amazonense TaxID=28077 RepID=A0A560G6X1_9PROT|nr:ABC transporter ATP-binding protein [Nitrospirillum amazonense]TWB29645.1 ABC-2 type transport system ATP-binding protein [Nitrospirillum amazonense]
MTPAPQLATAALDVSGLSHAFGPRQALRDVGFSLAPGDFTVLLGLNGAGKTTLFALVTRLYHSRQGRIAVFGHDIRRQPSAALAAMGVVFQQPTLDLDLTVRQNLAYHASLHGLAGSRARIRIEEELERVGLANRQNTRVRQLSGGQRRRVELARALVHDPALLLLDEPTVGLDIESRRFLIDHVRHLCRSRDMAVLWATHLIDEADDTAKVIVLHQGQVLDQGPVPQVTARAGVPTLRAAFDTLTRQHQGTPQYQEGATR